MGPAGTVHHKGPNMGLLQHSVLFCMQEAVDQVINVAVNSCVCVTGTIAASGAALDDSFGASVLGCENLPASWARNPTNLRFRLLDPSAFPRRDTTKVYLAILQKSAGL